MKSQPSATSGTEIPTVRLPTTDRPFDHRAARFRLLARVSSPLAGYLDLMAELADIQAGVWDNVAAALPMTISRLPESPGWRTTLRSIADRLSPGKAELASLLDRLRRAADDELAAWGGRVLAGDFDHTDTGIVPLVAAALQVHMTSLAARLPREDIGLPQTGSVCPVCGTLPVASLLQTGGAVHGLRYLVCGLCGCEWHRPRILCVHCGSGRDVAYFTIEAGNAAVKAEGCSACWTYLKIMDRNKDPGVDPFADDIASLALDLLMAEGGYRRLGINPLLVPRG
ncbi:MULTISPECIES: formate dehydrogenase accessory protein FdhE [Methylococcus]|uniref:Formate dehydrogenase accessory protein FdhE n=1 Tax=Methylococcus capsulatus TaxID=414 RepID=A0ABZ2F0Y3_METCP|nr:MULTISPECIES: formate dehydrogenase accessory protein FdhE [Methylococcus]MDF9391359.1 formate dehydrogenase accessory protein FdhE [Methylococcus capsulatus]